MIPHHLPIANKMSLFQHMRETAAPPQESLGLRMQESLPSYTDWVKGHQASADLIMHTLFVLQKMVFFLILESWSCSEYDCWEKEKHGEKERRAKKRPVHILLTAPGALKPKQLGSAAKRGLRPREAEAKQKANNCRDRETELDPCALLHRSAEAHRRARVFLRGNARSGFTVEIMLLGNLVRSVKCFPAESFCQSGCIDL
ncbi:hypothetical protein PAMP_008508 [Pampus punctatissimus]